MSVPASLCIALKQCANERNLEAGKLLHSDVCKSSCQTNKYIATALITLYSRCRRMSLAQYVFDEMIHPDGVSWTVLISGYVENGEAEAALELLMNMDHDWDHVTFVAAFKACGSLATEKPFYNVFCLEKGMEIHKKAIRCGFHKHTMVASNLVNMYSKCRAMAQAQAVFDNMKTRDVVSWNILLLGYIENGQSLLAMDLFMSMECHPNSVSFVAVLKACLSLRYTETQYFYLNKGMDVHKMSKQCGSLFLTNTLIDFYSKFERMSHAQAVFDDMIDQNVVSWNTLMTGYMENGEAVRAMELFFNMTCQPDRVSFLACIKACVVMAETEENHFQRYFCLEKGMLLHKKAMACGCHRDLFIGNALVDMYAACQSMLHARRVFECMNIRDVVSWTNLIAGYVNNQEYRKAMDVFVVMDCEPTSVTYIAAMKACIGLAIHVRLAKEFCLEKGMSIHKVALGLGDIYLLNTFLDMYSKIGSVLHAQRLFDVMPERNVVSWNNLSLGYIDSRDDLLALELLSKMDCKPDAVTFVAAIKAWRNLAEKHFEMHFCLEKVMFMHKCIKGMSVFIGNALVDMYGKCHRMVHARAVFSNMVERNIISWTSLMLGYVDNGESLTAIDLFGSMDCKPDCGTFPVILKAYGVLTDEKQLDRRFLLTKVITIHKQAKEYGKDADLFVANTLVDVYSKCGTLHHARCVFDSMVQKDSVSWTNIISGYVEDGQSMVGLNLFESMNCEPDYVTFVAALKACGNLVAVEAGERIHARICKLKLQENQLVANSFIDFYAKCGMMNTAVQVFEEIDTPDIVSWNALIAGYSSCGDTFQVFNLFKCMQATGTHPDNLTYLLVLTTCSHAGLVEEGKLCFSSIVGPNMEHYTCLIDMFGRANKLQEALLVANEASFQHGSTVVVWTTLLSSCKRWNNFEVGKVVFDRLIDISPKSS